MARLRPSATVVIGGVVQPALEWHSNHDVNAGLAQCSIVLPSPPGAGLYEDAPVTITASTDTGEPARTVFAGRLRGPLGHELTESDATVTVRCDGNLWRMDLPVLTDMAWVGPITPRKIIRQFLAFRGITNAHVEQFVHPTTGVPILLGGVPWFDDGRVICPAGTSPLAWCDRLCRLFGYRMFDRPDGAVRVARVCGPPPDADHTLVEGVDWLKVQKGTDLHEIVTWIEAQGASGTDVAGQQVAVVSRPKKGVRSKFIPNPPKWIPGSVSDALLVTQYLADAARIVKEFDESGVAWTISGETIGASHQMITLNPRQGFTAVAPSVGLPAPGMRFWQIGVSQDFGNAGYWTTISGWRPTGKPARTAKPIDPPEPDASPPTEDDLNPVNDPLPPTYDVPADDGAYNPLTDPDGAPPVFDPFNPALPADPTQPFDPFDPAGGGSGMAVGPVDWCPPVPTAPARTCQTVGLTEPGWALDVAAGVPVILPFDPIQAGDWIEVTGEVRGETLDAACTIEVWQSGVLIGSAPLVASSSAAWVAFAVVVPGVLATGVEAEVRFVVTV